jgi:hypothetical protein
MRRLTAWIGGAVGGITAYRFLRRQPATAVEPSPVAGDPAEELRAKLAETRAAEPDPAVEIVPPTELVAEEPVEPEPPEHESPEERRQRVHEEGRAALDEMKSE